MTWKIEESSARREQVTCVIWNSAKNTQCKLDENFVDRELFLFLLRDVVYDTKGLMRKITT